MKVLFVGDASNMHNCLAGELRKMGHEAVVASGGSTWMNTDRDINLLRRSGKVGAVRYLFDVLRALPKMRGFDVVHLAGSIFLRLRPEKNRRVLDYLRKHNGKIVLSALGTDANYYALCQDDKTFRYSDYMVGDKPSPYVGSPEYYAQQQPNWGKPFMREYCDYLVEHIDGAVACLYEYFVTYKPILGDRVAYAGIPIDTAALEPQFIDAVPEKVRFFIGIQPDRTVIKGTDRLLAALTRLAQRHPDECELEVVERVPYAEYVQRMRSAHALVDQLYSYTPATNALLAMAQGLVAVGGAEPEYYDLIGENDNHPIINVTPYSDDGIDECLEQLLANKDRLPALSHASRAFVEKHNAAPVVAQRYIDFWERIMK